MIETGLHARNKPLYGILVVIALFTVQSLTGKAGHALASWFSYARLDPDDIFAWQCVHHIVMLLFALAMVAVFSRPLKDNFGFQLGDSKTGMRYFLLFTAALVVISLLYHVFTYLSGHPITYDFPLNKRNVLGTLGFQLMLSGPAEEILYRALPVTLLIHTFGKSVKIKGSITLEIILSSLLFSMAHVQWSLSPFVIDANLSQLFYAFAIGTVQGMAYQESRSVVYPILMHSISNVLMVGIGYLFAVLA
ncbi:MAG: CPBP family intramembrane glutamic endopeptidase [Anaerolineaceae bacterium]|nr:CPBP family intramembrane glutamic endopeptidase [Anaerolineaceae bacterium]